MNVNTKTVGLSLQENVVLNKATSFHHWSIGDVIDDAAVVRVDQGLGLLLRLSDGIRGFTHVSLFCHVDILGSPHGVAVVRTLTSHQLLRRFTAPRGSLRELGLLLVPVLALRIFLQILWFSSLH